MAAWSSGSGRPPTCGARSWTGSHRHRLRLTWHPGRPEGPATEITVRFVAEGEQVRVVLEHVGWERLDDPDASRASYHDGWPLVLSGYAVHAG